MLCIYHKKYGNEIELQPKVETYTWIALKKTSESISFEKEMPVRVAVS